MPEIGEIKKGEEIGKAARYNFIYHACVDCGKVRWVVLRNKEVQNLRCVSCSKKGSLSPTYGLRGEDARGWKGGKSITKAGYVKVLIRPDDFFYSMAQGDYYIYEHRLVMAMHLERCLHSWEIVHHKGTKYPKGSRENRSDNRIENLQLVSDDRHKQITILEKRIQRLEQKIVKLKSENRLLKSRKII